VNRGTRVGLAALAGLGALVFALLVIGSIGPPREELQRHTVADVLSGAPPAARFGHDELRIVGWYAELDADCVAGRQPAALTVPWMERTCPLRVLLPEQPSESVTQAELMANGLRLAAPNGQPFPARGEPTGPNLRLQELVYIGHFNDPASERCAPELIEACRGLFVVSDYDGLIR
jgi:hypothetical protein